jgi:hypothetical protein
VFTAGEKDINISSKRILFDYIIMPFNPFVVAVNAAVVIINSAMRYGARQSIRQRSAAQSITAGGYGECNVCVCVCVCVRVEERGEPRNHGVVRSVLYESESCNSNRYGKKSASGNE